MPSSVRSLCDRVHSWNRPNDAIPSALPQKIPYIPTSAPGTSGWNSRLRQVCTLL
ncbi:hypothetical protein M404DRAFT_995293, partial [Pisolithus tinctorius Marx 270]